MNKLINFSTITSISICSVLVKSLSTDFSNYVWKMEIIKEVNHLINFKLLSHFIIWKRVNLFGCFFPIFDKYNCHFNPNIRPAKIYKFLFHTRTVKSLLSQAPAESNMVKDSWLNEEIMLKGGNSSENCYCSKSAIWQIVRMQWMAGLCIKYLGYVSHTALSASIFSLQMQSWNGLTCLQPGHLKTRAMNTAWWLRCTAGIV